MSAPTIGTDRQTMTNTQVRMFISQGAPCYRLPFAYPLESAADNLAGLNRRVHRMLWTHPGLASTFVYDGSGFFRIARPDLIEQVVVSDAGEVPSIEEFCADDCHIVRLRPDELPVRAFRCSVDHHAYLVLEFHHVAIDGIAASEVEHSLFPSDAEPAAEDPQIVADAYERVASAEATWQRDRLNVELPTPNHDLASGQDRLGRMSCSVPTSAVASLAKRNRCFPRVAVQAVFEDWLHSIVPGADYAWVSSWRFTLGIRHVVGNFPALVVAHTTDETDLADRCSALMLRTADPVLDPAAGIADVADVVFSYEDFGYLTGRFLSVDAHPRFALYLRTVVDGDVTTLDVEFDRHRVDDDLARGALTHLHMAFTNQCIKEEV